MINDNINKYLLPGLEGKVAVITGGAKGIGKTISLTMARLGAKIAIIDISEDLGKKTVSEIINQGQDALFVKGDVSSVDDIEKSFKIIMKKLGGLHILVNNAGITSNVSMDNLSLEEWKRVIDVNLTGSFICSKVAYKYILKSGGGSIIMISSGSSLTGSGGGAHYAASKGGINSLVRALSRELAPNGIRVNAVAPRYIDTEILSSLHTSEECLNIEKKIPLRRLGKENDVANVVAFLACDLSGYITGEVILVDGGVTFGG